MKIANPLYDHAFKYLMSNDKLARKVLSVILDKEVLELELSQQEVVIEDEMRRFTLYRPDFKAVIVDETGRREAVLIELQKSKLPTNVLHFRNYLELAYTHKVKKKVPETQTEQESALPIISIYILGYNVEDIPAVAVKANRKIVDVSRQEELSIQSDFIDLLTHTCYILQVRRLPEQRRSRIEQFLALFNQAWVMEEKYVLDLQEVPEEFKDIAEYLQRPLTGRGTPRQAPRRGGGRSAFCPARSRECVLQASSGRRTQAKRRGPAQIGARFIAHRYVGVGLLKLGYRRQKCASWRESNLSARAVFTHTVRRVQSTPY